MTDADIQLEQVRAHAQSLYGELVTPPTGVIHTLATVPSSSGRFRVIRIQKGAPQSSTDAFVLSLWRAHCDVILTTGQVIRSEPTLSYAQRGPLALGLRRYRAQVLGKSQRVRCAILTCSGNLPPEHPVFRDQAEVEMVVLTDPRNVPDLQRILGEGVEVLGIARLDGRRAIECLRSAGASTIGVEAGPSVAGTLYAPPALVDHLMLSICEAPVDSAVIGGALPSDAELFAGLACQSDVMRLEESGRWRFQHWKRAAASTRS